MKINYNCIRDLLLVLEEDLVFTEDLKFSPLRLNTLLSHPDLSNYTKQDIAYSLVLLKEVDFIEGNIIMSQNIIIADAIVTRITYSGHEFLETVRPKKIWDSTVSILEKLGSASFPVIASVASKFLESSIQNFIASH